MRILEESEINYSIDDIIDSIEEDTGFSVILGDDSSSYYVLLGGGTVLNIDFSIDEDIKIEIEFPSNVVDMSNNLSQADMYSTAIESASQIVEIVRRMTGGSMS